MNTAKHTHPTRTELETRVHRELPHLTEAESSDIARIVDILVRAFRPERVYVFGSQARGTPNWHSDVDLLVVVRDAGEFPHRLAQEAYRIIGHHVRPLEIVFMGQEEFDWRAQVITSLPATVLREGRLLHGAEA